MSKFVYLINRNRWALAFAPLVIVIFTFYNFYKKKEFKRPEVDYIKNMRFIQMLMG